MDGWINYSFLLSIECRLWPRVDAENRLGTHSFAIHRALDGWMDGCIEPTAPSTMGFDLMQSCFPCFHFDFAPAAIFLIDHSIPLLIMSFHSIPILVHSLCPSFLSNKSLQSNIFFTSIGPWHSSITPTHQSIHPSIHHCSVLQNSKTKATFHSFILSSSRVESSRVESSRTSVREGERQLDRTGLVPFAREDARPLFKNLHHW